MVELKPWIVGSVVLYSSVTLKVVEAIPDRLSVAE
jgi:hypothetical protein